MKCTECEGRRGYQPLLGPWDVCQACDGTGVSTVVPFEGPVVGFGELRIGVGACTISAPSNGPFLFSDHLPTEERILVWVARNAEWATTTRSEHHVDDWGDLSTRYGDFWWRPMPPPPPGV